MSMQDTVADMLTRIRNAQRMGIPVVTLSRSNLKHEMLRILKEEGFIENFEEYLDENKPFLKITLKYYQGQAVIDKITRVSCPSRRVYAGHKKLPSVRGGLGIAIISTPKGVMTDASARRQLVGGEVLCTVE